MMHIQRCLLAAALAVVWTVASRSEDALALLQDREPARNENVTVNYTQIRFEKILADMERSNPGMNVEVKADTFAEEQTLLATPVTMGPLVGVSWDAGLKYIADRMGLLVNRGQLSEGVIYLEKVPRFTDSFDGVPLGEAVREIARRGNANVIFSPRIAIDTPVTLAFTDVPWRQALESLLKAHGCTILYDAEDRIMRISTVEEADVQFETRSRPLRYVQPDGSHFQAEVVKSSFDEFVGRKGLAQLEVGRSLIEVLGNIKSEKGNITYESRTNTLIIRDTPIKIQEMLALVDEIDVAPQQVLIETRMVTVEDNPTKALGVRWGNDNPSIGLTGGIENGPAWTTSWPWAPSGNWGNLGGILGPAGGLTPDGPFGMNEITGGEVGALEYTIGRLTLADLRFMVQMAQYDESINFVQAPQILVLDNEEASVFIGSLNKYMMLEQTVDEGTISTGFQEEEVLVGVQLMVIPHVCRGTDQIILEIVPKQTDEPDIESISAEGYEMEYPARMRVKTVHTKMMLHSTETGVIAGLFRDEQTERMQRVPGLSRIPVIGKLFQHKSNTTVKQNTMILVTPTIIPPKHEEAFDRDVEAFRESLASSLK